MLMRFLLFLRRSWHQGSVSKISQRFNTVIHDDRPGDLHVEAKGSRDLDHMIASGDHFTGQTATFRPQYISRVQWMAKAWKLDGVFGQFYADQLAPFRECHVADTFPFVIGQVIGRFRCVGLGRSH